MNQEKIKELEKTIDSDYGNTVALIVQKNGARVYENYFNGFAAEDAIHVFSVTKSIFSALIGIAIDQGHIKSVDQKVLEFFPDYAVPAGEKTIQAITVRNLLTMTAPYKCASEPYEAFFRSDNWVKNALDLLGGEESTGKFVYSPIVGTHILSGILANATGQSILDFAIENLFSPLGINVAHNVVLHNEDAQMAFYAKDKHTGGWVVDPQGLNTASWGLTLPPSDMAKIGQLYLDGGQCKGKQIISAEWINESIKEHSRWGELSYGFLWWVIDDKAHIYAAMGDGGNVIYVNAKKRLVISIAALFMPSAKDRIDFILGHVEPVFED